MPRIDQPVPNTISLADSDNVNIGAVFDLRVQKMFSIYLWYPDIGAVPAFDNIDPSGSRNAAEYFFFTPPKTVSIDEPFATRVVGTQNGGKFSESHGSIFKTIRVQGTTGFRPRAGLPASIPGPASLVTNVVDAVNRAGEIGSRPQIPTAEITGYDDAMFLKNIFRKYSDLRSQGFQVVMIWRDLKDAEEWIVEPRNFRVEKNSGSPLTYNYVMDLNGLAKYSPVSIGSLSSFKDTLSGGTSFAKLVTKITKWRNDMTRILLVVATQINRLTGFVSKGADLLLGSVANVLRAINGIVSAGKRFEPNIRSILRESLDNIQQAAEELAENVNSGGPLFPDNSNSTLEVSNALVNALHIIYGIFGSGILDDSAAASHGRRSASTTAAYRATDIYGSNRLSATVGPLSGSGRTPSDVEEGRLLAGETIRDAATRLLGDAGRWHDLVLINDLTAPYTSDSGVGDGVLGPGDPILFPASAASRSSNQTSNLTTDEGSSLLADSIAAQAYGRDIRLRSVTLSAGAAASDLAVNQLGDIAAITGVDNVNQAVLIKFSTEKGELPGYSFFGAQAAIGSKLDVASFNTFRNSTLATILSDPRIKDIQDLAFSSEGDTLSLNAKLVLSNTNDYLSTNFALRRL